MKNQLSAFFVSAPLNLRFSFFLFLISSTLCVAQTSRSWNGSVSNDWHTAANWTPSGVPGTVDHVTINNATRYPVLGANDTINNLTLYTDTLDLGGFELRVQGRYDIWWGFMTNGILDIDGTTTSNQILDSEFNVEIRISSAQTAWLRNTFLDSVSFTYIGGHTAQVGGNTFSSGLYISAHGPIMFGSSAPDTFAIGLTADIGTVGVSDGGIVRFGYSSAGNYCGGDMVLNVLSPSHYKFFWLASVDYPTSTFDLYGDLVVSCLGLWTSGMTLFPGFTQHDGDIRVGAYGYHNGFLTIRSQHLGAGLIDLSGMSSTASVLFQAATIAPEVYIPDSIPVKLLNSVFNGQVSCYRFTDCYGNHFNGKTYLTPFTNTMKGNVFADSTFITRNIASDMFFGFWVPDTFLAPLTLNLEAACNFYAAEGTPGMYFGGDVIMNSRSGNISKGFLVGGGYSSGSATFMGDIILSSDSGSGALQVNAGATVHQGVIRAGDGGILSGAISLNKYTQTTSGVMDLRGLSSSALTITNSNIAASVLRDGATAVSLSNSTFQNEVDIEGSSLSVINSKFHGTTRLEKTGAVNNANGGNKFYGTTTIENSSSGTYLYWGSTADTILGNLTLINRSSQPLWMNYNTAGFYGGDITLDGDSLRIIRLGSSTAGKKAIFNGSGDQHLYINEPDLNVQFYRAQVNKSGGRLKVHDNITVSYELALTDGIIEMDPSANSGQGAVITLNDNVLPTASNANYIEGKVKKVGNDAFTFPVGRNGHYRPIGMSAPSNTTFAYTAEYLNENVHAVHDTSATEPTISQISTNDYWTLTRNVGTSNVSVTLSWDDMSCEISDLGDLLVAAWDSSASEWVDYGNGGTTGDTVSGTIVSNGVVSDYIAFALATDDSFECVPCVAYAGEDTTLLLLQRYVLGGDSVPGNLYAWTPSDYLNYDSVFNPTLQFPDSLTENGIYLIQVEVENSQGCVATDEVEVSLTAKYPWALNPMNINSLNANYYSIRDSMDTYFATFPVDTAEDGEYPRYMKWRNFWRHRVDFGDEKLRGSLSEANRLFAKSLADGENLCLQNTSQDLYWKPLGEQRMETASMGLISDAWVDTDDYKTLIVAPRGGGLFKTDDAMAAEVQWQCITDADHVPASGFGVMAVSSDAEVIVTSSRPTLWTHNYFAGVYYTTDGGDTWESSEFPDFDQYGSISGSKQAVRDLLMIEAPLGNRKIVALTSSRIYVSDDDGATFEPFHFNLGTDPAFWTDHGFLDMELDSRAANDPDYQYTVWIGGLEKHAITGHNVPSVYEIEIPNTSNPSGFVSANFGSNLTRFNPNDNFHSDLGVRLEHTGGSLYVYYHPSGSLTQNIIRVIDKFNESSTTFINFYETAYAWSEQLEISPDGTRMYMEPNNSAGPLPGTLVYADRTLCRLDLVGAIWEARKMNWDYWGNINPNTHADIRRILVEWGENGNPDKLVVGHDGGICYSTPGTGMGNSYIPNWQNKNGSGLNNQEMFSVSVQLDEKEVAYFASQDNNGSVFRGSDSGLDYPWQNLGVNNNTFRGDGYDLIFNQDDFTVPVQHEFLSNGGYSPYFGGCSVLDQNSNCVYPGHTAMMNVDSDNFLYFGYHDVMKYDFDVSPNLQTGIRLSDFQTDFPSTSDALRVIHVPYYQNSIIYAAKDGAANQGPSLPMQKKLFKCTNCDGSGPYNWIDIGQNLDVLASPQITQLPQTSNNATHPLAFYGITDVTTNPYNADKVWVSFNGFNSIGNSRVFMSLDGGVSWYEYSDGLPQFPINRIIYQEGSNDLLYAATDVGVYYRDASMDAAGGGWQCFSNDLPICAVSDLEIDYCEQKLYASTLGRGAWIVDLIEHGTDTEIVVNSDQTWDSDRRIRQTVITVESGNTLTIEAQIKLPVDAKIVVEPGAKLILDGGTLTCLCGMWQGIQLHGTDNNNQSWPNSAYHGIVELKNGAIIEHAKVGIDLIDNLTGDDAGGGIVKASTESIIRNCAKGVAFGPFNKHTNLSSFNDVTFLCDQPLQDDSYNGRGTGQFVSIWGTYGISFTNCTFEFDHDNAAFATELTHDLWPTGINSAFGGYKLLGTDLTSGNKFLNLQNGISSYSYWGLRDRVHSQYSTFSNVYRNAFIAGNAYPKMIYSDHNLPDWDHAYQVPSYGFMGNLNWKFDLFENSYDPMAGTDVQVGVIIDGATAINFTAINSGTVQHNYFTDMFAGTQTEENNLVVQIKCNAYDGNGLDWAVNPQSQGFLQDQGTMCPSDPFSTDGVRAGNTFENALGSYNIYDFNLQDQSVYYAAGGSNANTFPGNPIVMNDVFQVVNCVMTPSDPSCDPVIIGPHDWDVRRRSSQDSWSGKMEDLTNLEANIDSGQTQLLLDTIADLSTNDAVLASVLLNHSPLSDTVLVSYVARASVAPANFQNVMLRNVPSSRTVWEALSTKLVGAKDDWIPVWDTLQVAQSGNPGVSTATSLNREIRYHGGLTHQYADEVVAYYVDNDELDSAKAYMDTVNLYPLRLALLGTELSEGNWDEADSSLAKLPLVTTNDTAIYDLFDMLIGLGRDTLTILNMNSSDSLRVWQIAADTTLDASVMAKGILTVLLDTMFFERPETIPGAPSEKRGQEEEQDEEVVQSPTETDYFKVYPNPFSTTTTIEYNLGKDCELGCEVRIYDLQGRIILKRMLWADSGKGRIDVEMSGYSNGVYYCALYGSNQLLQTEKLILLK
ncbi:MAG: T9SS type A sorting domain-containing protein [Flavobacteriales bacterium]|nr:T9SS type A sorting domain-containing protein [Flavobacteriales bacterium]